MTWARPLVAGAAEGYTGAMRFDWTSAARELLLDPLAWASYAAWAAVWLTVTGAFGWRQAPGWIDGLLVLFLIGWMGCLLDELIERRVSDALLLVITVLALAVLWVAPSGASPILLILLATQFARRFRTRGLIAALTAVNAAFVGIMLWVWGVGPGNAGFSLLGFIGFQMFAVLVMRSAMRAEEMAEKLRSVNARLLATRSLLGETARDRERLRVSRELHDVAGHKLTALKLNLRGLQRRLDGEAAAAVSEATGLADELLQDLRSVVRHLRAGEGIDLGESLRELARPLPRPELVLSIGAGARVPRAEQAEVLLRVVQEALTNAARHGPAEHLYCTLEKNGEGLTMTIEDDGRLERPVEPGNGLTGMRERLDELGGTLRTDRSARGGLRLVANLPGEAPA